MRTSQRLDTSIPLQYKGDLLVYDGLDLDRLAPGTDAYVLTLDSAQSLGVKWASAGSGDVVGPASSVLNQFALFADTTGKLLKASSHALDGSGNELLKFASVASAVNEVTISNAATLGPPIIEATGGDTNIGLWLRSKGTGKYFFGSGDAGIDVALEFNGETSTGLFTWMEDEDYFKFDDDILMLTSHEIFFRATTQKIYSSAADTFDVNAPTLNLSGTTATNVGTVSGTTTVGVLGDVGLGTAGQASAKMLYPKTSLMIHRGDSTHLFGDDYLGGKIKYYNAVATAGWGVPGIYAAGRATGQTAAVATVATYTVGAADGSFLVSANVKVVTATAHSFSVVVDYTDESTTARSLTLNMSVVAGTLSTLITNAGGAVPYSSMPMHIRCKAATPITVKTSGTFTTVNYNVEGVIQQIA